ncbi:hypothetical protein KSP39_PZI005180 [Platanthera zijinensis]|uniref:Uncharacterized protein n=1 Tax=Platanthera zijinensis TaxID=2320716 RepID=A0AAP0BUC8_9ASPA
MELEGEEDSFDYDAEGLLRRSMVKKIGRRWLMPERRRRIDSGTLEESKGMCGAVDAGAVDDRCSLEDPLVALRKQ